MICKRIPQLTRNLLPVILLTLTAQNALAQGTAFTYQGKLTDGGNVANGAYDMQFKLYDTMNLGTGTQQGSTLTVTNIALASGIFTVQLDLGACPTCFDGNARYLEIAVKKTTDATYTTLSPRQPVSSTPYALRSLNAATADGLSVACINCVTSSQISSVNGSAVTGVIPVASVPDLSTSYIKNTISPQTGANFNISGDGTIGGNLNIAGTLTLNIVNANTQFNLGGQRVLSNAGTLNLFAGVGAGNANTGAQNSFFGSMAGQNNTTGGANSFFGSGAGQLNTTGGTNSFFGLSAGQSNTTQSGNTFIGSNAGLDNGFNDPTNLASFNTFVGTSAGASNRTGGGNSFFGFQAGFHNTSGIQNAFFGYRAGAETFGFCCNSFFGFNAGTLSTANDNSFFGNNVGNLERERVEWASGSSLRRAARNGGQHWRK